MSMFYMRSDDIDKYSSKSLREDFWQYKSRLIKLFCHIVVITIAFKFIARMKQCMNPSKTSCPATPIDLLVCYITYYNLLTENIKKNIDEESPSIIVLKKSLFMRKQQLWV